MEKIKTILILFFISLNLNVAHAANNDEPNVVAATVDAIYTISKDDCEKNNEGHNYACQKDSRKKFCEIELTESTSFKDALPFGETAICIDDVLANLVSAQQSYSTLNSVHGLENQEKSLSGKILANFGYDRPQYSAVNVAKSNQHQTLLFGFFNTLVSVMCAGMGGYVIIKLLSKSTQFEFEQEKYVFSAIFVMIATLMLIGNGAYALILLVGVGSLNFIASMLYSNGMMAGEVDQSDMLPFQSVEMQTIKENFFISNLEASRTLMNQIRYDVNIYKELNRRLYPFNYNNPDRKMVRTYQKAFQNAYAWKPTYNNSALTGFDQTEKLCVQFSNKYKDDLIYVNLDKGFNETLDCLYSTDKTKYDAKIDNTSIIKSLFNLNITEAIKNVALYNEFMLKNTGALEKGIEIGIESANNFDNTYLAYAKNYVESDQNFFEQQEYTDFINAEAEKLSSVVSGLDIGFNITVEDQKIMKAFQALIAAQGIVGVNSMGSDDDRWFFDDVNALNIINEKVFKPWDKNRRIISCSNVKDPTIIKKNTDIAVAMANDDNEWKNTAIDLNCVEILDDGTVVNLITDSESDIKQAELNVQTYEFAFKIWVKSAQDIAMKAYSNSLNDNGNARQYIENQRKGAIGLFYNMVLTAKAMDKLSRVKAAFKQNLITSDGFDYKKGESYTFVRSELLNDVNVSLDKINIDSILAINTVASPLADVRNEDSMGVAEILIDQLLESFRFRCVNPVYEGDYYGAACADPTFVTVFLNSGDMINSSSTIIGGFYFAKILVHIVEMMGSLTKIMGPQALLLQQLAVLLGDAFVLIMGVFAAIAGYVLTCVITGMLLVVLMALQVIYAMFLIPLTVFMYLLALTTITPIYALFTGRNENIFMKTFMGMINTVISSTVSLVVFLVYFFNLSGTLNGQITATIDNVVRQDKSSIFIMVITAAFSMGLMVFIKYVLLPFKDLMVYTYIKSTSETIFNGMRTSEFGLSQIYIASQALGSFKRKVQNITSHQGADNIINRAVGRRGLGNKEERVSEETKPLASTGGATPEPKSQKDDLDVDNKGSQKADDKGTKSDKKEESVEKETQSEKADEQKESKTDDVKDSKTDQNNNKDLE